VEPAVPSRRVKYAVRVVVITPLAVYIAFLWHPWPRHGLDRVRHAVHWIGCVKIAVDTPRTIQWPHARQLKMVVCEKAGPGFWYARFRNQAELRTDLLHQAPFAATCLTGNEVVVDGLLDPGEFPKLCRELGGRDVNGVAGLPDLPENLDPRGDLRLQRDRDAEEQALRLYWSSGA
jgi:hypothetical protein